MGPSYAREPVRFADGIGRLTAEQTPLLIEVGPGNALSTLALQVTRGKGVPVISSMQDSERQYSDRDYLLEALGKLWAQGHVPDWNALHHQSRRRVPLPTYPFERRRYWIDPPHKSQPASPAPLAGNGDASQMVHSAASPIYVQSPANQENRLMNLPEITSTTARHHSSIIEELSGERPASTQEPGLRSSKWGLIRFS